MNNVQRAAYQDAEQIKSLKKQVAADRHHRDQLRTLLDETNGKLKAALEENSTLKVALSAVLENFKPAILDAEAERDRAQKAADKLGATLERSSGHQGKRERDALNEWYKEREQRSKS